MSEVRRAAPDWRIRAGIVGPVLFVGVFLVAGALRPGYDPVRMQVSYLSLGDGGAVQVASFLVSGLLIATFAVGLRARLAGAGGRGAVGGPVAAGSVALGLVVAGIFSTVPAFGYPPGTPDGFPSQVPATAYLHVLGAVLFFGGMIAAPILLARRYRAGGAMTWAWFSVGSAIVVFAAFAASSADPSGRPFVPSAAGLLQRIAIVAGLAWIAVVAWAESGLPGLQAPVGAPDATPR
jgi:hypothetical protein